VLELASARAGCSLSDLTVLSTQKDPYRLDTPANHRDGQWVAEQLERLIKGGKKIHWRGLHYAIVAKGGIRKPDGEVYVNSNDDWEWLSEEAGKAARWLRYVPFERIIDNRNAPPIIHRKARVDPKSFVSIGLHVEIPNADDLEPWPFAQGFEPRQAYHFVIFGEKASLEDAVLPIARAKEADLYLPTGEISDTLIYQIAKEANDDGRPMVMFTLSDCDPSGWQMAVSIARKLQAFRDLFFPKLEFEVVPVALNVEQVRELGLPSTPLKETEKRADRWREAFGVEQTEIDALATLRPDVLREILERAFDPYFDRTLAGRVSEAKTEWREQAEEALREQIDQEALEELRAEAAGGLCAGVPVRERARQPGTGQEADYTKGGGRRRIQGRHHRHCGYQEMVDTLVKCAGRGAHRAAIRRRRSRFTTLRGARVVRIRRPTRDADSLHP
jgi:hypothetical protein